MLSEGVVIAAVSQGTILDVNAAFCEVTGYTREELVGKSLTALGLCADAAEGERVWTEISRSRDDVRKEIPIRARSGEIRTLSLATRSIELSGHEVLLGRITDLTPLRESERRLTTRIRRQARISELGRRIPAREPAHLILEASLETAARSSRSKLPAWSRTPPTGHCGL